MKIIIIVGFEEKTGAIGYKGGLYYSSKQDMVHFRKTTLHTVSKDKQNLVIMGRNTWESLPKKPLEGRRNIILTSRTLTGYGDKIQVYSQVEQILDYIRQHEGEYENAYIIGGGLLYQAFLEMSIVDEIIATVFAKKEDIKETMADTFFPLKYLEGFKKSREEFLSEDMKFIATIQYYKKLSNKK